MPYDTVGPGQVINPLTITGSLGVVQLNSSADFAPVISGGTGTGYKLSLVPYMGKLPAGRSIVGLMVTGKYVEAGAYAYVLRATDSAGNTADLSVTVTVSVAGTAPIVNPLPINTIAPVLSGTASLGATLTSNTGTWSNSPTGYSYIWQRDGVAIAGATSSSYTLVAADMGKTVTCRVSATNAGGTTPVVSNGLVIPVRPTNAIRNLANNGYVRSLSGGYSTFGAPTYA